MKIRKAKIEDLGMIQELNAKLFELEKQNHDEKLNLKWSLGPEGEKYFKEAIEDEEARALVAEADGRIVGYLAGWIKEKENPCRQVGKEAELENMFVLEKYRKKGIGSELVKEFLDWSRQEGVKNVRVGLYTKNKKALEFYKKLGFEDYYTTLEFPIFSS